MVVGTIINPEVADSVVLPILVALKLRDEKFYKQIISDVGCNATEIIDRLVTHHNAWELFAIDPKTKEVTYEATYGYDLCTALYAISPHDWRWNAYKLIDQRDYDEVEFPDGMFHSVVKILFDLGNKSKKGQLQRKFCSDMRRGMTVNSFLKCIELVEFKDQRKRM